jgi:dTMP kinase
MAADRAEHVDEVVEPALAAGRWVVTDRYSGSTIAYQGHGRGLELEGLGRLVTWAASGLAADLVVVLDVPLDLARRRLGASRPDRLEGLDEGFHVRVRDGFLAQAADDPAHWVVVAAGGTVEDVAAAVHDAVTSRLGRP